MARIRLLVSAVGLAALPLLLSTCRVDSLFRSRTPSVEITLTTDTTASRGNVAVLDTVVFTPVVTIDNGSPAKPLPLRWFSSNPNVAAVELVTGKVIGVARGTSVITVQIAESALGALDAEASDTVQVIAASLALAPADTTLLSVNDTLCYRPTVLDGAGGTIPDVAPALRVAVDPDSTVRVVGTTGCVAARSTGTPATIAASLDTSTVAAALTVRQRVDSIHIQDDRDTLFGVGETASYPATALDRRQNLAPFATIAWTTSNPNVVSVDAAGQATAQGEGTAYVRAGADDGADSVQVTVTPPRLVVSPDPAQATASEGNTNPRTVQVAISNGGTGSVNWTASGAGDWLSLSKTSGTAPDMVTFTFDPTSLAAGTHPRNVVFTAPGAAGSPRTVPAVFQIAPATAPSAPQALTQLKLDGSSVLTAGGTTDETSVILRAQLNDGDEDASLRLEVEVQPVGANFGDTATAISTAVSSGQTATATTSGLLHDAAYHWQARTRDETGRLSTWTQFGGNPENATDFRVFLAGEFVVTGSGTQTAGASQTVKLTAKDGAGNTMTAYTGDKTLTFSGASNAPSGVIPTATDKTGAVINFGTVTTLSFVDGVATTSIVLYRAETATIAATDGSFSATGANRLTLTASAADASTAQTTVNANPTMNVLANGNQASTITVQLKDSYQNITTTGVGSGVTGTATNGAALTTFTTGGGGTYTASLTSTNTGTSTVTVMINSVNVTQNASVTFVAAVLVVTGSGTQTAGAAQTVTITATDASGPVTSYTGDKSLTFSGAAAAPSGTMPTATDKFNMATNFGTTTTVTFVSGVANTSIVLYRAEIAAIAVSDGTISAGGPNRLTITVSPGTVTQLVVTGNATQTAGASQTVTLTAQDAFRNTATSYTADKSLTFSGAGNAPLGTVPTATNKNATPINFGTATTLTFSAGVATSAMVLYKAEAATIAVTDGLISAAGANRLSVTVSPADASTAESTVNASPTSGLVADGAQSSTITVQLKDVYQNNTTTGVGSGVTATATNGASMGSFTNGGGGTYTASLTSTTAATSAVTARINGTAITHGSNPVSVTFIAGPAAKFVVTGAGTQTAGNAQTVTITARDAFDNTATSYAGDKDLTFSGAGNAPAGTVPTATNKTPSPVAFGAATTLTFTSGVSTSSTVLYKAETALIAVSAAGPINTTGGDRLSVTVSPSPTSATASTVSANPTTGVVADGVTTSQVTVTLKDQYENPVPGKMVSLDDAGSPSIISASGTSNSLGVVLFTVTDTLAETVTYTATANDPGSIVLNPASVTFVPGPLDHFFVGDTGGGPIPTRTAGVSFNIRVVAQDAKNNTVTSFNGAGNTVTLSSSSTISAGGGITATFANGVLASHPITLTTSGSHTITATRTSGGAEAGTSNSFTVDPAGLDHFLVESNAGGNIPTPRQSGAPFLIRITAQDQFNNTVTSFTGTTNIATTNVAVLLTDGGVTTNFVAGVRTGHSVTLTASPLAQQTMLRATRVGGTEFGESNTFTVNPP